MYWRWRWGPRPQDHGLWDLGTHIRI
jgi:hypothetical protein